MKTTNMMLAVMLMMASPALAETDFDWNNKVAVLPHDELVNRFKCSGRWVFLLGCPWTAFVKHEDRPGGFFDWLGMFQTITFQNLICQVAIVCKKYPYINKAQLLRLVLEGQCSEQDIQAAIRKMNEVFR